MAIPGALLFAAAITWPRRLIWLLALTVIPIAEEITLDREFKKWQPPQDWCGAIDWLTRRFGPHDVVWAYPNEGALPLFFELIGLRRRDLIVPARQPQPRPPIIARSKR